MKVKKRTEFTLPNRKGNFDFGKEYWLGFDYRKEDWKKDSNPEVDILQIHEQGQIEEKKCQNPGMTSAVKTAPFIIQTKNGITTFHTFGAKARWSWPVQEKKWHNLIIHFVISSGNNGFVEVWKDGTKLGRINGANAQKSNKCGAMKPPYLKMGIYKWDWQKRSTDSSRRQLFIDNLKLAEGSSGYSLVSSGSAPAPKSASKPAATKAPAPKPASKPTPAPKPASKPTPAPKPASKPAPAPKPVSSRSAPINNQLIAHWLMDSATGKVISDRSGNRLNGTLVNGAKVIPNEGVKFDGVDDYLNVGKLDVGGDSVTVGAWFWANDLSNCEQQGCRIISKATGTSEQDHYFMISTIKVGSKTRLRFRLKTNGKTSTLTATSGNISRDEWVHVTASYDGERMRLYQDGIEVGSMEKRGNITTNGNVPVWIGSNPPNAKSRPWKGNIADVRVYNYAMTKPEVSELASADVSSPVAKNDVQAPKISNMKVDVTDTTAIVSWNTNEASDSLVGYGLTKSYGEFNDNSNLFVTNHKVTLANLEPGRNYHYRVRAKDKSGNTTSTADLRFSTPGAVVEDKLITHLRADAGTGSTVFDSSGNGFVGKLKNGAKLLPDEGAKFDGINDYMDIGKLDVAGDAITVGAWFWSDDLSNCKARDCRIISKATGVEEQDHYFMVSTIEVGKKTRLRFRLKTNGNTSTLIANSGDIYKNEWFHVAASYDGERMRLYKDGVEVGSMAKKGHITTNSKSSVWVGDNPPYAGTRPWKGNIGEVRVYNYPMTNAEVRKLVR